MRKTTGMVLAEVVFALFVCGVLLGVSIYMFKSNDISKTPYIYSVLKNLPDVNTLIMQDCYRAGTCKNTTNLPDNREEYCTRLADIFSTAGEVNCSSTTDNDPTNIITQDINGKSYIQNFKLSNGVSFYGIVSTSNSEGWYNEKFSNGYIDVFIDINGAKNGDNEIGSDIFPIRIFRNGDVIPSYSDDSYNAYDDEDFFAYRVILDHADPLNINSRLKVVVDTTSGLENITTADKNLRFREKVSFIEAVCVSHPDDILNYFSDIEENSSLCANYNLADICDFSKDNNPYKDDTSAFCTIEAVKPRGTGIFKIFGI